MALTRTETKAEQANVTLMYKIINNHVGIQEKKYITPASRETRRPHILQRTVTQQAYLQYSFFPRTIKDWNELPSETAQAMSVLSFRGMLTA